MNRTGAANGTLFTNCARFSALLGSFSDLYFKCSGWGLTIATSKAVAALRGSDRTLSAWVHGAGDRLQTVGAWPTVDAMEGEEGSSQSWERRPAPETWNSSEINVLLPSGMGAEKPGAPGSVLPALEETRLHCRDCDGHCWQCPMDRNGGFSPGTYKW